MIGILLFWLRCNRHSHTRDSTQMLASDERMRFVLCYNDSVCWSEPAYRHQHFAITLTAALAEHWFLQLTFEVPTVDDVSMLTFKHNSRLKGEKPTESCNQIKFSELPLECAAFIRSQTSQLIKHILSHKHINGVDWPDLVCCSEQRDTCILPSYDPKARYRLFGSVCLCRRRVCSANIRQQIFGDWIYLCAPAHAVSRSQLRTYKFVYFDFCCCARNERKFIYRDSRISLAMFIDSVRRVGVRYTALCISFTFISHFSPNERENFRSDTFLLSMRQVVFDRSAT